MIEERWTMVDPETNTRINITPADVVGAIHGARKALMVFKRNAPLSAVDKVEYDLRVLKAVEDVFAEATERIIKEDIDERNLPGHNPVVGKQTSKDALGEEGEVKGCLHLVDQVGSQQELQKELDEEGTPHP